MEARNVLGKYEDRLQSEEVDCYSKQLEISDVRRF
jgi:hypothetical protein